MPDKILKSFEYLFEVTYIAMCNTVTCATCVSQVTQIYEDRNSVL